MRTVTFNKNKYSQYINFEGREIFKFGCSCPDFIYRKIKTETPCKHLNEIIKMCALTYPEPKQEKSAGLLNLTEKQKEVLRQMVEFTCENCHKKEDEVGILQAHRMRRGNKGGKYVPHNIKMFCDQCHRRIHEYEF